MMRLVVVMCFVAGNCMAHETYDSDCCSGKDCKPIPIEQTPRVMPDGYLLHDGKFRQQGRTGAARFS